MKYLLSLLVVVTPSFFLKAQDTLTTNIFPEGGNQFAILVSLLEKDEVPFELFDTTKNYFDINLDTLYISYPDTELFKFTKDADGGNDVPNSEFAFKASFGNGFFRRDSSRLNMVGFSPDDPNIPIPIGFQLDEPVAHFVTPMINGDSYRTVSKSKRELGLVTLRIEIDAEYKVCGYGKLRTTADTTYDVLRVWRKFIYSVTTVPIFGDPSTVVDSLITWEFYNNDVKNTILRVDARPTGIDTIWHFDFFEKDLTVYTSVNQVDDQVIKVDVFNWDGQKVFFTEPFSGSLKVFSLNGALVKSVSLNSNSNFDLNSISKGTYVFVLTDAKDRKQYFSKVIKL